MRMLKISRENQQEVVRQAVSALKKGKVLIGPTDTIYGFLADATNAKAVAEVFLIKKRNVKKPLGIFVKNLENAKKFVYISKSQEGFLKKAWPGKVTVVLKSRGRLPKELGVSKTLGIRIPKHVFLQALLRKLGCPIAQTSVNIAGKSPMQKVKDMVALFAKKNHCPDLIVDAGMLPRQKPSRVVDLTGRKPKILRP